MTVPQTLFDILDVNQDGELSRSELHAAAKIQGWYWREAPLFALLDFLTLSKPLSKDRFTEILQQVAKDPLGPYGDVLLDASVQHETFRQCRGRFPKPDGFRSKGRIDPIDGIVSQAIDYLGQHAEVGIADAYQCLLASLDTIPVSRDSAALLIIDPQRSFTEGVWMQSIGTGAEADVAPIQLAFDHTTMVLRLLYGCMEITFSRCPFPPDSYEWYDSLGDILDSRQAYFLKPGNSILFPPTNGFRGWIDGCMEAGIRSLVIGGCTLNSCVRVSSMEVQSQYATDGLQVIVDVSLCGARGRNYLPAPMFGGVSPVESAVAQMAGAGVAVVKGVHWE